MRVYLLLLLLVLVAVEAKPKGRRNSKSRSKGFRSQKQDKEEKVDLRTIHDNLDDLDDLQGKGHDILDDIQGAQNHNRKNLFSATQAAGDLGNKLKDAAKSVESSFKDSKDALKNQEEMFSNQEKIAHSIIDNHEITRKEIDNVGDRFRKLLGKSHKNQDNILHKIKDGRDTANKFFDNQLSNQKSTFDQLKDLVKELDESAAANAHGQLKISKLIQDVQADIEKGLDRVADDQKDVAKALEKSQDIVEKRINTASDRQGIILNAVKNSNAAINSDLDGLQKEQLKTLDDVLGIREEVLNSLENVKSEDGRTQNILHKCKEGGCDTRKVEDFIQHITKQVQNDEKAIEGDLVAIHNTQSKVQAAVKSAESNALKELSKRTDGTLHEVKAVEKELSDFLRGVENTISALAKDVESVKKTQADAEHKLQKIFEDLNGLSLLNKEGPSKRGKGKFEPKGRNGFESKGKGVGFKRGSRFG